MKKPRIRLLLVMGMAVAVLTVAFWVGLMVSATPVYADDGSATTDETAIVDETTPTDETATVDETAPADETTTVDETADQTQATDATIQSDKADYAFYETPVISGTGFAADTEVTVTVTAPDGTATTFTAT